ncbi:hypothetical protein amb1406 [Paramagnetospirillum magneticum AMB-1]|uniref:Uncharacterized protein n=1 Tax=Paramagnetospirillum magneticum (strain ATCC 700264 / AMB-1) TaxID=342108 RepID=Q2W7G5_PARM1|nr:hypothetical protein amb1406 [Paramagnetospirillum magneticum AMB-1]
MTSEAKPKRGRVERPGAQRRKAKRAVGERPAIEGHMK